MTTDALADAPVGCLEADAGARILRANAEAARLLGEGPGALRGRPLSSFFSLAARMFFQTHVMPTLDLKGRVDELYLALRRTSGEPVPVLMNAARRRTPDGGFVDLFAFLPTHRRSLFEGELIRARQAAERSASGERTALERIDAMQSQLAVAERMASVGALAAGVAHEINNPLAYVSANVEMVAEALAARPGAAPPEIAPAVAEVQQGLARIRDVVSSLRKLSRVDDERRDPVDLGRVVDVALKLSGLELRHRARVEVDVADPAPRVLGDEGRLCQIAVNLLVNAAQALAPERRADNLVRVVARYDGDERAVFEVRDNGPGVPPALQERVFEPFFTTKPVGEGTGLGLSVCHGIVSSLGGAIALESEPGRGACFRVTLPCLPRGAPPPPSAPPPAPAPAPRGTCRLLIVDDEVPLARVFARALGDFDVTCCSTGRAALERLAAQGFDAFDAILCDLIMPEMTGMELHAAVAAASPAAARRMIFMTGGTFLDSARDFLDGIDNVTLVKPFKLAELRRALATALARPGPARRAP
ncbi:MAG TPA: ATP-binding protein [Polyangiaceae bacterium]|nr:ATP-binding protein [Polyangiaceae bacterium]